MSKTWRKRDGREGDDKDEEISSPVVVVSGLDSNKEDDSSANQKRMELPTRRKKSRWDVWGWKRPHEARGSDAKKPGSDKSRQETVARLQNTLQVLVRLKQQLTGEKAVAITVDGAVSAEGDLRGEVSQRDSLDGNIGDSGREVGTGIVEENSENGETTGSVRDPVRAEDPTTQEIKVIFQKANPENKSETRFDIQIKSTNGEERTLSIVLGNYEEIGREMKTSRLSLVPWSHKAKKLGFLFYEKNRRGLEKSDGELLGFVFDVFQKQALMSRQKDRLPDGTRGGELEKIGSVNIFSSGNTLEEFINWSKEGRGAEELTAVNSMVDKLRNSILIREHRVMRGSSSEEPMQYVFQELSVPSRSISIEGGATGLEGKG